ncbi:polysaccharide biosynthesis/export family protein [Oceanicella actignis]|uniref:polysaccharide biosynthesis/export family protein n=1 Tax=Oceanicella actignis TaxID=1189325 RepID=UPI0011E6F5B4|nr:polysaccharide biosynthesis/export family protein [Oceanicella actignis]TYO90515.1 polysaccharide export outer membrane protein [Oceanicella actignis]
MRFNPTLRAVLILTSLLGGCARMPEAGPKGDVVRETAQVKDAPYLLVPLDPAALDALEGASGGEAGALRADAPAAGPAAGDALRVGDLVTVTVWEAVNGGLFSAPQANGPRMAPFPAQRVAEDGAILVPYAGRIRAAGRTPRQVERAIEAALAGKAIEPQALVTRQESPVSAVTVLGDAANGGGRVALAGVGERVLDVIAAAGGLRAAPHRTLVRLTRGRISAEAHLSEVLRDPAQNVPVRPGDVVNLVEAPRSLTVFGAAARPSKIEFPAERLTLDEALALAGGLSDDRADPSAVFVMRRESAETARALTGGRVARDVPVVYNLDLSRPESFFLARRFEMRDKDIIYAANAPIANFEKVMRVIALALQPVSTGVGLARLAR